MHMQLFSSKKRIIQTHTGLLHLVCYCLLLTFLRAQTHSNMPMWFFIITCLHFALAYQQSKLEVYESTFTLQS